MEKYIGSARNLGELLTLLESLPKSATLKSKNLGDDWSYLEVWYDPLYEEVIFK